ncbi:TetR family transcriptional regulator [Spirochaetia bacterium]|nr:TetR family transcriptional regulator [Spirochaetia bacterium]
MPPTAKFNRESVMACALQLVREEGLDAVSARAISVRLGCSTRPLYSLYTDMEKLKADLFECVNRYFGKYLADFVAKENRVNNEFMKFGLAYIAFAKSETNLFKMLFLTDSIGAGSFSELVSPSDHAFILDLIPQASSGMKNGEDAQKFFLDMWIYTHGMAMMSAFGGIALSDTEQIQMLTHAAKSLLAAAE